MDNEMDNQELISALADGQLQGEAFARGVQAASGDARARETWCAYHVVGEVLRTGRAAAGSAPEAFLARLRERLEGETPVAAAAVPVAQPARPLPQPAANDWIWKLAAGVASVAAVAAVGWNMFGASSMQAAQPQLAVAPIVPVAPAASAPAHAEAAPAMIRDPRLDRLLAAHRQLAGTSVLQAPSGFLRNATFEAPSR
ncbi:MAG TPA: sigma-E factor negative regulatory protein [Ramlibacter sp.]|uniref:sigma-E factor negative regulatory protein n=1 Tax=Ramlibacter sp. TaxID=1917967 RepID=UPI002D7F017C|nr:sigma-E factor negative regulatory protein [Ramlibacter sp.]HET8745360.1 sigma-E factor negative regulatory protein [Ramlibacter sp.]